MKALIIDDDRISRNLLDIIIKEAGFESVHAADGIEALEQLNKTGPFDLLLVDWDMPRMDGLEFIKRALEHEKTGNAKIVMVTCHDNMKDAMTATSLGIDSYLVKPISVEKINNLLVSFGFLKNDSKESPKESDTDK